MLKASAGWSEAADAYAAGKASAEQALAELGEKPGLCVGFCTVAYDEPAFVNGVQEVVGDVPMIGSTSFMGILTPGGFLHQESGVGGVMLLASPEMTFGVGASEVGDDPRAAGQRAVRQAIAQAGKAESDAVSAFFLVPAPGAEESLIMGVEDVIGRVPMIGGSAANQMGEAPWMEFANNQMLVNGVAVGVIYSDLPLGTGYTGYYKPTAHQGIITKVSDKRTLVEIDGRKALEVYAEWRGMKPEDLMGGELLGATIPYPLGMRDVGSDHWWIRHPVNGNEDGSMAVGSDLAEGTAVTMMQASLDEIAEGAGEVVQMALDDLGGEAGAVLVAHCGGRAAGIGAEAMEQVGADIRAVVGDTPFIGYLTFGEQGCAKWSGTGAGGLMLAAMALGK